MTDQPPGYTDVVLMIQAYHDEHGLTFENASAILAVAQSLDQDAKHRVDMGFTRKSLAEAARDFPPEALARLDQRDAAEAEVKAALRARAQSVGRADDASEELREAVRWILARLDGDWPRG